MRFGQICPENNAVCRGRESHTWARQWDGVMSSIKILVAGHFNSGLFNHESSNHDSHIDSKYICLLELATIRYILPAPTHHTLSVTPLFALPSCSCIEGGEWKMPVQWKISTRHFKMRTCPHPPNPEDDFARHYIAKFGTLLYRGVKKGKSRNY